MTRSRPLLPLFLALLLSACGQLTPEVTPQATPQKTQLSGVSSTLALELGDVNDTLTGLFTVTGHLTSAGRGVAGQQVTFSVLPPAGMGSVPFPLGEALTDARGVATLVLPFSLGEPELIGGTATESAREVDTRSAQALFGAAGRSALTLTPQASAPPAELFFFTTLLDLQVEAVFAGAESYRFSRGVGSMQGDTLFGGSYYTADFEGLPLGRPLYRLKVGQGVSGPSTADYLTLFGKRRVNGALRQGNVATAVRRGGSTMLTPARAAQNTVSNPQGGQLKLKFGRTVAGGTVLVTRLTVHNVTKPGGTITVIHGDMPTQRLPLPVTGAGKSATVYLPFLGSSSFLTPASFLQISAPSAFAVDDVRFQTVDLSCACGWFPFGLR